MQKNLLFNLKYSVLMFGSIIKDTKREVRGDLRNVAVVLKIHLGLLLFPLIRQPCIKLYTDCHMVIPDYLCKICVTGKVGLFCLCWNQIAPFIYEYFYWFQWIAYIIYSSFKMFKLRYCESDSWFKVVSKLMKNCMQVRFCDTALAQIQS